MNLLDVSIIVVLGFFFFRGGKKGLIREVFGFVAVLGALIVAVVYMDNGVALIKDLGSPSTALSLLISFVLIFAFVFAVVRITGAILQKLIRLTLLGWLDRLGGLFFGLVKGTLIVSLILLGLTLLSWPKNIDKFIDRSAFGPSVQMAAPRFFNRMKFLLPAGKTIYLEFRESVAAHIDFDPEDLKERAIQRVLQIFQRAE